MTKFDDYHFEPEAEWAVDHGTANREIVIAVQSIAISVKRHVDWLTGHETTQETASARFVARNAAAKANDQAAACPGDTAPAEKAATA